MNVSRILGLGSFVPPRVVTNDELAERLGVTPDWIFTRTGIRTRRFVEEGVGPADLAAEATHRALEQAQLRPSDLDLIIFATFTPDYQAPGSSWFLQQRLGLVGTATFDVRAQCAGFLTGLSIADQFVRTGTYKHVLVIGAEVQSSILDWSEAGRSVALLFGDGAGAAVIGPSDDPARGVVDVVMHSDGTESRTLWMPAPATTSNPYLTPQMIADGRHFLLMDGRRVFEVAVKRFPEVIREVVTRNNMTVDDIKLIVPHQANLRIIRHVTKTLGADPERVYTNIQRYGNTSAASIPIALDEAVREGRVQPGDPIVLAAFGGGFAWASALINW